MAAENEPTVRKGEKPSLMNTTIMSNEEEGPMRDVDNESPDMNISGDTQP